MIWSKQDFEREVRRQLVELASIRKRLPSNPEVLERIGRLEESHVHLLRKLDEVFPKRRAAAPAPRRKGRSQGTAAGALEQYLRTVEAAAGKIRAAAGATGVPRPRGAPARKRARPQAELPSLGLKCASCGKVLFSSLLGGEEIVRVKGSWHHRECVGGGDGYSKPSLLN